MSYIASVIVTAVSDTRDVHVILLCAGKGWSEDNTRQQQSNKDCYFHSLLCAYQPSQGWSHLTCCQVNKFNFYIS